MDETKQNIGTRLRDTTSFRRVGGEVAAMSGLALIVHAVPVVAVTATLAILVGDAVAEWRSLRAERLQQVRATGGRPRRHSGARPHHSA